MLQIRKFGLLFCLCVPVLFYSCRKEGIDPVAGFEIADFEYYKNQFFANKEIVFINKSNDADDFYWDFGDGKSSDEENPSHTYEETGDYTIILTVRNGHSEDKLTKEIVVNKDRYELLTSVPLWRLIGMKQNGEKVELDYCDRCRRMKFLKDFKYTITSTDESACDVSYEGKWKIEGGNTLYESSNSIGQWYGHHFYLTEKILILKMPQKYEFIYEPDL